MARERAEEYARYLEAATEKYAASTNPSLADLRALTQDQIARFEQLTPAA